VLYKPAIGVVHFSKPRNQTM